MCPEPSRCLWARTVVVGIVIATAISAAAHAQNTKDPRESPEVRRLVIEGVSPAFHHDLERSIATRASMCRNFVIAPICRFSRSPVWVDRYYLDQKQFERDVLRIRAYYWNHGYREATVDTSVVAIGDRQVAVTFRVHENRPTLVGRLTIAFDSTLIEPRRITKITTLREGQPFDLTRLDSMRVGFVNELWSRGYSDGVVDTTVTVDDSVTYTADVALRLVPNHATIVGAIEILGLEQVGRQTVLNSLAFHENEPFRRAQQLESQRNLYESNLFRFVTVSVPDSAPPALRDSVKKVEIVVSESPLHEARVGTGFSNIDFVQAEAHYTAYNVLGGARRLDVDAAVGNLLARQLGGRLFFFDPETFTGASNASPYLAPTWSVSTDFRQPAFLHRPRNQAGLSGFAHRRSTPGIFVDRGYGGAATLTRQLFLRAPASLTYRFEITRVTASDVYFCVSYGVCDTLTIGALRAHRSLSPLSLTGFIDRSDVPLDPTRGYQARINFEHASTATASDYRYNRAFIDAAAYHHTGVHVFGAHLRVGIVRSLGNSQSGGSASTPAATVGAGVLHPRKRFYSGGASSVRGYAENQLGPRILTIDPEKLTAGAADGTSGCAATSAAILNCDPNVDGISNRDFLPQPLGGTSLIEGSVEWRFPTSIHRKMTAAVFLDAGVVGESNVGSLANLQAITKGSGAITPGVGLRYSSAVGPIRFDIGFNPKISDDLTVVTEVVENGQRKIVALPITRRWSNSGPTLLDRLTLHFSIGQPY